MPSHKLSKIITLKVIGQFNGRFGPSISKCHIVYIFLEKYYTKISSLLSINNVHRSITHSILSIIKMFIHSKITISFMVVSDSSFMVVSTQKYIVIIVHQQKKCSARSVHQQKNIQHEVSISTGMFSTKCPSAP